MRNFLLVLFCCSLAPIVCPAQQPPASPPILQIYVQDGATTSLVPKIALGLAQPALKISSFQKCVHTTDRKSANKLEGLAVQLKPDDAKILSAVLAKDTSSGNGPVDPVWFATAGNKVLGYLDKELLKREADDGGTLVFFADDDSAIYNYLLSAVKAE